MELHWTESARRFPARWLKQILHSGSQKILNRIRWSNRASVCRIYMFPNCCLANNTLWSSTVLLADWALRGTEAFNSLCETDCELMTTTLVFFVLYMHKAHLSAMLNSHPVCNVYSVQDIIMIYHNEQGRLTVLFKYIRCKLCVTVKVQVFAIQVRDCLLNIT